MPGRERLRGVLAQDLLELFGGPTPLLPLAHHQTDRLEERRGFQLGKLRELRFLYFHLPIERDHLFNDGVLLFQCGIRHQQRPNEGEVDSTESRTA